jgi:hypothetical protein
MSVIISQDDKANIGLEIPAVGRTFHTVYLMIKSSDSNDAIRTGQLAILYVLSGLLARLQLLICKTSVVLPWIPNTIMC